MTKIISRETVQHEARQLKALLSPHTPVYSLLRKQGQMGGYYTFHAVDQQSRTILNISYAVSVLLSLRWTSEGHVYNKIVENFAGPDDIIRSLSFYLFGSEEALEWRQL